MPMGFQRLLYLKENYKDVGHLVKGNIDGFVHR